MKKQFPILLLSLLFCIDGFAAKNTLTAEGYMKSLEARNPYLNGCFEAGKFDEVLQCLDSIVASYKSLDKKVQKELNLAPQLSYFYVIVNGQRKDAKSTLKSLKKALPYGDKYFRQYVPKIYPEFKDNPDFAPYFMRLNGRVRIPLKNIRVIPFGIEQPGSEAENIADEKTSGDAVIFHTIWGGIKKIDITLEADLAGKGRRLDRIVVSPRANGLNGIIRKANLWVMAGGKYRLIKTIDGELSNRPIEVDIQPAIKNPQKVKLEILDSYGDRNNGRYAVSLGELECQTLANPGEQAALLRNEKLFEKDGLTLKEGVTPTQIKRIKAPALKELAQKLYTKSYDPAQRVASYQPYLNTLELAKQMHMGDGFSKMEGITGMLLSEGDNYLFVKGSDGVKVNLIVPDWMRRAPAGTQPDRDPEGWGLQKQEFRLKEGLNQITLRKGGNAYIQYFTDTNPAGYSPVTVHFVTGRVNGYFDLSRGDTNAQFDTLLAHAPGEVLDIRGRQVQLAFPVASLRKYAIGRGVEFINSYDSIVSMEKRFCGWEKEGINFSNHILGRVNCHYFMFRDEDGMAFLDKAMDKVCDPQRVVTNESWGICHEMGHVFQMIPQMTWTGMTEVSNNILTMYATTRLGNKSRLSGEKRYEAARKNILDKGISYMAFTGKTGDGGNVYGEDGKSTNVFERLVPFWQLYLYFHSKGYDDFYPDLMIALRKQEPLGKDNLNKNYLNMLEFCRLACVVSKTDLTDFFQRWGFFYVGDIRVVDYNRVTYQVTQEEIDALKAEIARMNLPKPTVDIATLED